MAAVPPGTGSTVRRILLGSQLRRLRESRGITREAAGYEIRASESKISRMELGRVSFKERDVLDLLTLYGVTDPGEREAMRAMVREANKPGWWHSYADVLPSWFPTYVGLEEAAALIRTYEVQFIPGLLQTEDYARAVSATSKASAEEIQRRIEVRLRRQQRLTQPHAPRFWSVIDEAALRRRIGGPEVMRGQLQHLITLAKMSHITVQVMPFHLGAHPAEGGAFVILRYTDPELPDIVYVEQLTGAHYLEKRDDVDRYVEAMQRLSVQAPDPDSSIEIIEGILNQI